MLSLLLSAVLPSLRDRASLQLELIALRHQLLVLERKRTTRIRLTHFGRFIWVWLYRVWPGCLDAVVIVHRHSLAPTGVSAVLELEIQTATARTPPGVHEGEGFDPAHEPGELAVGRPAHPR